MYGYDAPWCTHVLAIGTVVSVCCDVRKDAEINRLKLIEAASSLMQERGADVPMEMIASRAGVTRGTLYRNFGHRYEMYEAVLKHDLERLRQRIALDGRDTLAFIRWLAEMMISYDRFLVALSQFDDFDLATNHARMVEVIAAPLADAQAEGVLRSTLTGDDVIMACRMLASHWRLDGVRDPQSALDRRLALLIAGLGSRPVSAGSGRCEPRDQ